MALIYCLSKVVEPMVNLRPKHHSQQHSVLDHRQHVFRPVDGMNSYFAALGEVQQEANKRNHDTETISLNI